MDPTKFIRDAACTWLDAISRLGNALSNIVHKLTSSFRVNKL